MITFQRANKNNSAWFTRLSNLTFSRCSSWNRNCFPSVLSKVLDWVKALCSVNQVNPTRWEEQGISGAGSISDRKQTMNCFYPSLFSQRYPFLVIKCYKTTHALVTSVLIHTSSLMSEGLLWIKRKHTSFYEMMAGRYRHKAIKKVLWNNITSIDDTLLTDCNWCKGWHLSPHFSPYHTKYHTIPWFGFLLLWETPCWMLNFVYQI